MIIRLNNAESLLIRDELVEKIGYMVDDVEESLEELIFSLGLKQNDISLFNSLWEKQSK